MTRNHSEGLGERDTWSHEDLYAPQTRVSLLLHAPGSTAPAAREQRPVSGIDMRPTLLARQRRPRGRVAARPPPADRIVFVQDYDTLNPRKLEDLATRGGLLLVRKHGEETLHDAAADPLSEIDISAQFPKD